MHRPQIALTLLLCTAALAHAKPFSGARALEFTRQAVANGARPSGSPAIHHLQAEIIAVLKKSGCQLSFDDFPAATPVGAVSMRNILCRFPGKSGKSIVVTGHYDTKRLPGFVGANDGGSSTGFLMELAGSLAWSPRADDVWLVFFDGEEAVHNWTDSDSLYGSRHLADLWSASGMLANVKALINVDMIGDKDLALVDDMNSNPVVRALVWKRAAELGYGTAFPHAPSGIEDDHIPFLHKGVRALDLIDFNFGPGNRYWHTPQDTMDKLSAASFDVIGTVVLDAIRELETMP